MGLLATILRGKSKPGTETADPAADLSWPGTSAAPNAPAGWDPFPASHWPVGVPKNSYPPQDIMAVQAFSEVGGSRGGTMASPPDDPEDWSFYHNTVITQVWPTEPYVQTPRIPDYTDSVNVLPGGAGASPYMEAQSKDWPGSQRDYRYREYREPKYLTPRLDGNRTVPNTVIPQIGMNGDVGLMAANFTSTMVDNTPGWNSNTYVTTQNAGTTTSGPDPSIPSAVTVSNDQLTPMSWGL